MQLTVQLWYDPGAKRVHLTSNDPDLPKAGVPHQPSARHSGDQSARALLAKFGKLPDGA